MAYQRLQREFIQLMKEPIPVGTVTMDEDDPLQWKAIMIGPEGSPYENGLIEVDLRFTTEYPIKPPSIIFKPPFFHANVGTDGNLCLSLFQDWRPSDTVTTILLALNNLFLNPNRKSPLNGSGLSDQQYWDKAKKWTDEHGKF